MFIYLFLLRRYQKKINQIKKKRGGEGELRQGGEDQLNNTMYEIDKAMYSYIYIYFFFTLPGHAFGSNTITQHSTLKKKTLDKPILPSPLPFFRTIISIHTYPPIPSLLAGERLLPAANKM